MSKIETELQNASKIFPNDDDDKNNYLHRLLQGVAELEDSDWDGLSENAQDWFNKAVEEHNNQQGIPKFPDAEEQEKPEPVVPHFKTNFAPDPGPKAKGSGISKITDSHVISIKSKKNPKRVGSRSHEEFAMYTDGMTVKEYLDAGGSRAGVRWDYNNNFIALSE